MSSEDQSVAEPYYEVERIDNSRQDESGGYEYLVKWKGYKKRTWEPVGNLSSVADMIYTFNMEREQEERKKKERKKQLSLQSIPAKQRSKEKEPLSYTEQDRKKLTAKLKSMSLVQKSKRQSANFFIIDSDPQVAPSVESNQQIVQQPQGELFNVKYRLENGLHWKYTASQKIYEQCKKAKETQAKNESESINEIVDIKMRDGKWMVKLSMISKGEVEPYKWYDHFVIRGLYPLQLLSFYEKKLNRK